LKLKVIDEIVPEPVGGAQRNKAAAVKSLGDAIERALNDLVDLSPDKLRQLRREKFLSLGAVALG
jgi:acetyl-CoA carboxylase carboxyl transferase subunit alpha